MRFSAAAAVVVAVATATAVAEGGGATVVAAAQDQDGDDDEPDGIILKKTAEAVVHDEILRSRFSGALSFASHYQDMTKRSMCDEKSRKIFRPISPPKKEKPTACLGMRWAHVFIPDKENRNPETLARRDRNRSQWCARRRISRRKCARHRGAPRHCNRPDRPHTYKRSCSPPADPQ